MIEVVSWKEHENNMLEAVFKNMDSDELEDLIATANATKIKNDEEMLIYLEEVKKDRLSRYFGIVLFLLEERAKNITIEDIKSVINLDIQSFKRRHNSIIYTYLLNSEEKEYKINIYELMFKIAGLKF